MQERNEHTSHKRVPIRMHARHRASSYWLLWPGEGSRTVLKESRATKSPNLLVSSRKLLSEMTVREKRPTVFFHFGKGQVFIFAVLVLFIAVPFYAVSFYTGIQAEEQQLFTSTKDGIAVWEEGYHYAREGNMASARVSFVKAQSIFSGTRKMLRKNHPLLVPLLSFSPVKPSRWQTGINLILGAERASEAGVVITDFLARQSESGVMADGAWGGQIESLIATFERVSVIGREVQVLLDGIDVKAVPEEYRQTFTVLTRSMPGLVHELEYVTDIARLTSRMLGFSDGPKTVLLVFQNNAELRASGGFIGSYGLVKLDEGKVTILDMPAGGTYDFHGSFRKALVSPKPLHLINPVWQFQDANWWPDWPTTAKKISWFYEQGNGATVDGVISMTPTLIERLLSILGPVDMTATYGMVIDRHNFYDVVQKLSERGLSETRTPKKIIGELAVKLIEKVYTIESEKSIPLLAALIEGIEQGQLLVYVNEVRGEELLKEGGYDGSVKQRGNDYLMVIHTNIAGGKSDREIKDNVTVHSTVREDGSVINSVTITRTHHGRDGTGFGGVRNVDYLRVYVPLGSTLVSVSGERRPDEDLFEKAPENFLTDEDYSALERTVFYDEASGTEVFESFGKTVFANWFMVDPGESSSITFEYMLPYRLSAQARSYDMYVQKQAGFSGGNIEYYITFPESWRNVILSKSHTLEYSDITDSDKQFSIDLQKQTLTTLENGTHAIHRKN